MDFDYFFLSSILVCVKFVSCWKKWTIARRTFWIQGMFPWKSTTSFPINCFFRNYSLHWSCTKGKNVSQMSGFDLAYVLGNLATKNQGNKWNKPPSKKFNLALQSIHLVHFDCQILLKQNSILKDFCRNEIISNILEPETNFVIGK